MSISIEKNDEIVILICRICGNTEHLRRYCPLTGHHYGEGFTYVCSACRGPMEAPAEEGNDEEK